MPYGFVDDVKSRLHIATNITSQDPEILKMIQEADDFIDSLIGMFVTVPLVNPVPEQIRRLSNKLATEWYYHYNNPMHPMEGVNAGKREIEQFVRATYAKMTDTVGQNRFTKTASGITGTEV